MTDIAALSAEFPRAAVSWRAQNLTQNGDKALALAYIDARDVMDRLDAVCSPENWQDRYEFHGARTVCYLSIRIGNEWITKADGAGDSDVEAEKGAISDALKRAAVKWGIGRYLYSIESPWVPCESYEKNGKKYWKRWTADPWSCIRGAGRAAEALPAPEAVDGAAEAKRAEAAINAAATKADLKTVWDAINWDALSATQKGTLSAVKDVRITMLSAKVPHPDPKNLGQHLDNLHAQESAANPH